MKILHVSEQYAPVGGAESYLLNLLDQLEMRGVRNVVAYRQQHSHTIDEAGRKAVRLDDQAAPASLRQLVDEEKPDVIYLHLVSDHQLITAAAAMRPTVAYIHNFVPVCPGEAKYLRRHNQICPHAFGWVNCAVNIYRLRCASARHPRSVLRILQRTAAQQAALANVGRIFVASNYMQQLLLQNGFDTNQINILPYFIDMPTPGHTLSKEDIPSLIVFGGRLEPEKGFPVLLEALKRVQAPYRLLVVGDGSMRADYELLVNRLQLGRRVDFVGWRSKREIADYYARARLLAFPSIWPEPFGLMGPEAMVYHTPAVGFAVGGVPDWLHDGENGFLVQPGDVEQFASKIELLLQDQALARAMGQAGKRYVAQAYSAEKHVTQLMHYLAHLSRKD